MNVRGVGRSLAAVLFVLGAVGMFAGTGAAATDVEITGVDVPDRVDAGERITVNIDVENAGDTRITGMDVALEAFGQRKAKEDVDIRAGRTTTVTLNLTVPADASGPNDMEITADAGGDRDVATVTLDVAALYLTLRLSPETVSVGDHVTVSGSMSASGVDADLYVGGRFEATVTSDETAQYTHTITPERAGTVRVTLRAGGTTAEKILHVEQDVDVSAVTAPSRIAGGERFRVCAILDRATPGSVDATLLVGGEPVTSRTVEVDGETETCFTTAIEAIGAHEVAVRAAADGVTAQEAVTVEAVETGITASVFPRELTLRTGQAGVFRIDIANDELRERTFTVTTSLANMTTQAEQTVTLGRGGSETAVIRVVPRTTGTHTGTVTVRAGDMTVAETPVEVVAVQDTGLDSSVVAPLRDLAGGALDRLGGLPRADRWAVVGIAGLLVVGLLWLWRRRRHNVMQPQYS